MSGPSGDRSARTIPTPSNFAINFTGDYEEQQKAFRELLLSITLALLLVYMIMAMLYESLRDPFIVMFSVPLAVIGVVLLFSAVFLPRLLPGKILEDEAVLGLNGTVSVALVAGEGEVRELAGEPPEGEGYSAWAISGNREEVAVAWFRNDPRSAEMVWNSPGTTPGKQPDIPVCIL